MTEVTAIPLSPNAVPSSSRSQPIFNEAVLNTVESTDIRSDIESNKSQPGQVGVESQESFAQESLQRQKILLIAGIPPVSFVRAMSWKRRDSLGITPYRMITTAVFVLGIPSALLSFLGNAVTASGIIGVAVALCSAILFWVKEYRDQYRNWAPWLFEKDLSKILVIVWFLIRLFVNIIFYVGIALQVAYLQDGTMSVNAHVVLGSLLAFSIYFTASLVGSLTILSNRYRLWLGRMHFLPCMLLEEVMIAAQRLISILLIIGYARLSGLSFEDAMYFVREIWGIIFDDRAVILTSAAMVVAMAVAIVVAMAVATVVVINILDWFWPRHGICGKDVHDGESDDRFRAEDLGDAIEG